MEGLVSWAVMCKQTSYMLTFKLASPLRPGTFWISQVLIGMNSQEISEGNDAQHFGWQVLLLLVEGRWFRLPPIAQETILGYSGAHSCLRTGQIHTWLNTTQKEPVSIRPSRCWRKIWFWPSDNEGCQVLHIVGIKFATPDLLPLESKESGKKASSFRKLSLVDRSVCQ